MLRKDNSKDVTDKEFNDFVEPHGNMVEHFIEKIIAPEVVAFYIATGYYKSAIWEGSFQILINDALEFINCSIKDSAGLKENIKNLLYTKYLLKVTEEEPLLKIKEIP